MDYPKTEAILSNIFQAGERILVQATKVTRVKTMPEGRILQFFGQAPAF